MMNKMQKEYAINLLADMLRMYTPSLQEVPLAKHLAEKMSEDLGFKYVNVDSANNVTGKIGTGLPRILLCGHMDTVPGNQPVKITKDSVHGRGACDAKSSLAAMLLAVSELSKRSDVGTITFAGVSDEEGNGTGTRALLDSGLDFDYAIFGEPSGIDNVTIGYKGRVGFTLASGATGLHASAPWLSQNAIERLYEVWQAIKKYANERAGENQYTSVTVSLTQIQGGSSHNTTPDKCRMTIDLRIPPQISAQRTADDIAEIVNRFQSYPDFPKLNLNINDITEPFETDKTSDLVRAIIRAILEVRRKRPLLLRKTGTGDMNLLGHRLNIPVVTYGPGNPHLSHTRREFVEISEYLTSIEVYKATIINVTNQINTI